MERTLSDFLRAYGEKRWAPGTVDCCLMLASWAIWLGHPDPAAHLRGTYDSDEGFAMIVERAGGVVPLVSTCAAGIGGKHIQRPSCGDIGVYGNTKDIRCQFGAIFDGERWVIRTPSGLRTMPGRALAAWAI